MGKRVADCGLQVEPLGQAHMVKAVRTGGSAEVLAVGDQQGRQTCAVQSRCHAQAGPAVAVEAMDKDRPSSGSAWNQPGWHRPQFVGEAHFGEGQTQRLPGVAGVDGVVDRNLEPGGQVAADTAQASRHARGIALNHISDDRVATLPFDPVDTRAQRFFGTREDNATGQ